MPYTISSRSLPKDKLTCALIVLRVSEVICEGERSLKFVECCIMNARIHTLTGEDGMNCTEMCKTLFSGVLSERSTRIREPLYKQVKGTKLTQCICRNDTAKPNLHWMGDSKCEHYYHWASRFEEDVLAYPMTYITVGGRKRLSQASYLVPGGLGAMALTDVYWQCGTDVWITLPPGWIGCCSLVTLDVSLIIIPTGIHPRSKRSLTDPNNVPLSHRRSTRWDKFWRALVPAYGAIENAHDLDRIGYHLESLIQSTMKGFHDLTSEVKAIRTVALQNRAALDYLLAKQGGVCAIVADTCCTYIPDASSNMSDVENQLGKLQKALEDEHATGADPFAWLTNIFGPIWARIVPYLIMATVIFVLLFCCCICGIPCLKALVNKMISTATVQMYSAQTMVLLKHEDVDSDEENEINEGPAHGLDSDTDSE